VALGGGGDPRWWLWRQRQAQLIEQDFLLRLGLGVATEDEVASIGGRQMHIDHLDGGEVLQRRAGRESGRQGAQPGLERNLKAIGQEGDEDMRLDAILALMVDRANAQIPLDLLECLLDTPSLKPL
jgi:hypothetical protein